MTSVEAQQFLILDRIAHVKLVATYDVAFAANTEQFAFDSVQMMLWAQLQSMATGNERESFLDIRTKLAGVACFTEIVSGDRDAAAKRPARVFEAADIVTFPAMERDRNLGNGGHGRLITNKKRGFYCGLIVPKGGSGRHNFSSNY